MGARRKQISNFTGTGKTEVKSSCTIFHLMDSILMHLLCAPNCICSQIYFLICSLFFIYIYKEQYSLLLRLLRRTMLRNLLPRTTFVREEASRDEALRTTEWRASLRTLIFILQRVFFTLGARRHLRRCPEFLKQKKHFFEKLMSRRTTVFCISLIT